MLNKTILEFNIKGNYGVVEVRPKTDDCFDVDKGKIVKKASVDGVNYQRRYDDLEGSVSRDVILPNGDILKSCTVPETPVYLSQNYVTVADIIKVEADVCFSLTTKSADYIPVLQVSKEGKIKLEKNSKVEITDTDLLKNFIISTDKNQYTEIADTKKLVKLAQIIQSPAQELQKSNKPCEQYHAYRHIKEIASIKETKNDYYEKHPLKDLINYESIDYINKNIFSLYGVAHSLEGSNIHSLTPDILGYIESYLEVYDIIL